MNSQKNRISSIELTYQMWQSPSVGLSVDFFNEAGETVLQCAHPDSVSNHAVLHFHGFGEIPSYDSKLRLHRSTVVYKNGIQFARTRTSFLSRIKIYNTEHIGEIAISLSYKKAKIYFSDKTSGDVEIKFCEILKTKNAKTLKYDVTYSPDFTDDVTYVFFVVWFSEIWGATYLSN